MRPTDAFGNGAVVRRVSPAGFQAQQARVRRIAIAEPAVVTGIESHPAAEPQAKRDTGGKLEPGVDRARHDGGHKSGRERSHGQRIDLLRDDIDKLGINAGVVGLLAGDLARFAAALPEPSLLQLCFSQ